MTELSEDSVGKYAVVGVLVAALITIIAAFAQPIRLTSEQMAQHRKLCEQYTKILANPSFGAVETRETQLIMQCKQSLDEIACVHAIENSRLNRLKDLAAKEMEAHCFTD